MVVGYEINISGEYEKKVLKPKNIREEFLQIRGGYRSSAEGFLAMEAGKIWSSIVLRQP